MKRMLPMFTAIALVLASCTTDSTTDSDRTLQPCFTDNTYQLTGIAISPEGRRFACYPRWSDTYRYGLVEIINSDSVQAYPNDYMNSWTPGDPGLGKWICAQAVYIDASNTMWVVDAAAPMMGPVAQECHKLVRIDLATDSVERIYPLMGAADSGSYINDVRVDSDRQYAYLTNSSQGGIIVVNLATGAARQVLQDHYSVHSDPAFRFVIDGRELQADGKPVKIHSDGIALTHDRNWLYYKPLTDDKLYRVPTAHLRDTSLSASELASKVEDLGHFAVTDGMVFDESGNLYIGDIQHSAIKRIAPDHTITTLVTDPRLVWPDSYAISDDGYLYITTSQIQKQPKYNDGVNKRTSPYTIFTIKIL